jgi:two-component system, NarL family, nitrate/nitrite response regulator NarL
MPLNILVVDDHPMMLAAVADLMQKLGPSVKVFTAETGRQALRALPLGLDLDLAVVDIGLPDMTGFEVIASLKQTWGNVEIAAISGSVRRDDVHRAIAAGATGYIFKATPAPQMLMLMRKVLDGDRVLPDGVTAEPDFSDSSVAPISDAHCLTERQKNVLRLLCTGQSNKIIAAELAMSEKTVKGHVTAIFKWLGVVNRTQAVLAATQRGLIAND